MGRPKKEYYAYVTASVIEDLPKWKRAGRTDTWIATRIGVSLSTLKKWKDEHEEFNVMFKKGREELLESLEESAYSLALGKKVRTKSYAVDSVTGEILDNMINISEKHVQSVDMLKHTLAVVAPEKWGKVAMEGKKDGKDKEDKIIFSGEDDL